MTGEFPPESFGGVLMTGNAFNFLGVPAIAGRTIQPTDIRPDGWMTPVYGSNAITHELLVREGLAWHADALDTSLPRLQQTPSGNIVALPWSDFVDNRVLRASPRNFFDVYKDTFDYLYTYEPMGLSNSASTATSAAAP